MKIEVCAVDLANPAHAAARSCGAGVALLQQSADFHHALAPWFRDREHSHYRRVDALVMRATMITPAHLDTDAARAGLKARAQ